MTGTNAEVRELLSEFLDRRARGEAPEPSEFLERNPHVRAELAEHFDTIEALERLVKGSRTPLPRETVLGDFRILRELGRGGMGVVFLADQISLPRKVALKLLAAPLTQSPQSIERFRREAETAARLRHPNLVAVYTVGETRGYRFYAMEYVEGASLSRLLARLREDRPKDFAQLDLSSLVREIAGPPEEEDEEGATPAIPHLGYFGAVARIVAEVADGLAFAHAHGVIHRDVKPQNVLLDRRLAPLLADFGLARDENLETLSRTGDLLGTYPYMSPEMAMAGRIEVDRRTDVYSLGVTLFELLTLSVPFTGKTSHEVLRKVLLEEAPSPRRLNPHVPRDLQVIALRAMEKDPDHRFAHASEMAEELRRFIRHEPIRTQPPGPVVRGWRFLRRHWVGSLATAALLVGSVAVPAAFRRVRIGDALRGAEQAKAAGRWVDARAGFLRVREDFGEVPAALAGLEEVERAVRAEFDRLKGEGYRNLDEFRARPTEASLLLAVRSLDAALELREDPALRRERDQALPFAAVEITSEPPGADVTILPGEPGSKEVPRPVGITPIPAVLLPHGTHRMLVVKAGFGFGEYLLALGRADSGRRLHATLRRTEEVVAEMVRIPAGTYPVGFTPPKGKTTALSPREAEVAEFYIDRTEVTNEAYARFLRESGHPPPKSWRIARGSFPAGKERLPVSDVTWHDAEVYAEWAGKRLPTDVEWEVACRGADGLLYPYGPRFDPERAVVNGSFDREARKLGATDSGPEPVDSRPEGASPFGLLHMAGNVREWVRDTWAPRLDGFQWGDPFPWPERVIRGDSWRLPPEPCFMRSKMAPGIATVDVGFRCAKSASP